MSKLAKQEKFSTESDPQEKRLGDMVNYLQIEIDPDLDKKELSSSQSIKCLLTKDWKFLVGGDHHILMREKSGHGDADSIACYILHGKVAFLYRTSIPDDLTEFFGIAKPTDSELKSFELDLGEKVNKLLSI